jgi:hypothetical protein
MAGAADRYIYVMTISTLEPNLNNMFVMFANIGPVAVVLR